MKLNYVFGEGFHTIWETAFIIESGLRIHDMFNIDTTFNSEGFGSYNPQLTS